MNRVADNQLEFEFDADEAPALVRKAEIASTLSSAQVVCLASHLTRKAELRDSTPSVSHNDSTLIDRIANRVRFF